MNEVSKVPANPVAEASELLTAALRGCAPELEARAKRTGLTRLTEAHHLAPEFRESLTAVATAADLVPDVCVSLSPAALRSDWPRLGPFDVSLRWNDVTVYGELKCGDTEDTLEACAWDALKCAFALRHGFGAAMFLIAGAPQELWQRRARGCELFGGGEWDAADLRARYVRGFTTWERDGYKPQLVPDRIRTIAGARLELDVNSTPWALAIAQVEPVGDGWLTWGPFADSVGAESMDAAAVKAMLERHFEYAASDPNRAHDMYQDDAVLEFPQSGERFVGVENLRAWRSNYPASTVVEFRDVRGSRDLWVAEISIRYDEGPPNFGISILELRDGKIARETIYVAEGWEAPEWRAQWRAAP